MLLDSFWHSFSCWLVLYSFPESVPCSHPSFLSPWRWGSAMDTFRHCTVSPVPAHDNTIFSLASTTSLPAVAHQWLTILLFVVTPFKTNAMIDAFSSNLSEDIPLLLSCLHIHLCDFGDRPKIASTTSSNWSSITVFKVCYIQPSDVFLGFMHVSNFLWLCEPTYITWTTVSSWVHGVRTWVLGQIES